MTEPMKQTRPNVILFTTDQHRGDHLSIAGHPVLETPNLDAMVNHGAYFPNAYTEIPSTTGARRCLLGGQGSYDCGLVGYSSAEWHEPNTVATVLTQSGYHCINVGWRNLHPRRKLYGFHSVICHDLQEGADDYWDWLVERVGPDAFERGHGCDANGWLSRPWHLPEQYHPTNWTTDTALSQIEKSDPTKPVFIWVSHLRPHSPYDPPGFFWNMYIDSELPEAPVGDWAGKFDVSGPGLDRVAWFGRLTGLQNQRMRAGYMGCITHIDYEFGRMLEMLKRYSRSSGRDDWLIVFTADHGDMMGDHCLHRKTYAYEGSARIPFLVQYPSSWDMPSGTFDHVVGLQDVMPTILESCGVSIPSSVTGTSVLNAIRGESWRPFFHGEHSPCYSADEAMHYLTDGKQKYIYFPKSGSEMLFDLSLDRQERTDLSRSAEHADDLKMWRQRLVDKLAPRNDGFSDGKQLLRKNHWSPNVEE